LARRLVDLEAQVILVDNLFPGGGGNHFNIAGIESKVQFENIDVRDTPRVAPLIEKCDFLFNLAGQTSHHFAMADPQTDVSVNCCAQLSILETCRHHNPSIKVVFSSTRQVYGVPQYLPVDEQHPLSPADINGINKAAGESYHMIYHNLYGVRACILRLTNTYGPRMRVKDARQNFLGIWLRRLIEGSPIDVFGDGRQARDLNHVNDVVNALLLAAVREESGGQIFNLGASDPIELRDLATLLIEINGGGEFRVVPFPAERKAIDIGSYCGNYGLIRDRLDWVPQSCLEEGLEGTLKFYREHYRHYW
jgi:nucleoside-diphosphate-sugar epimerase